MLPKSRFLISFSKKAPSSNLSYRILHRAKVMNTIKTTPLFTRLQQSTSSIQQSMTSLQQSTSLMALDVTQTMRSNESVIEKWRKTCQQITKQTNEKEMTNDLTKGAKEADIGTVLLFLMGAAAGTFGCLIFIFAMFLQPGTEFLSTLTFLLGLAIIIQLFLYFEDKRR